MGAGASLVQPARFLLSGAERLQRLQSLSLCASSNQSVHLFLFTQSLQLQSFVPYLWYRDTTTVLSRKDGCVTSCKERACGVQWAIKYGSGKIEVHLWTFVHGTFEVLPQSAHEPLNPFDSINHALNPTHIATLAPYSPSLFGFVSALNVHYCNQLYHRITAMSCHLVAIYLRVASSMCASIQVCLLIVGLYISRWSAVRRSCSSVFGVQYDPTYGSASGVVAIAYRRMIGMSVLSLMQHTPSTENARWIQTKDWR